MKISRELRKAINAAVRENVRGANPLAEVGLRGEHWKPNALRWSADDDLGDLTRLALLREIDDDEQHPGCAVLDLYVTTGTRHSRELETNVYVAIKDGRVVAASDDGREFNTQLRAISFPFGAGWLEN